MELQEKKMNLGLMGSIFGSADNAKVFSVIIVLILFSVIVGIGFFLNKEVEGFLSIILLIIGYLVGRHDTPNNI